MQGSLQRIAFKTSDLVRLCDCRYSTGVVGIVSVSWSCFSQLITHINRSLTQAVPLAFKLSGLMHLCGRVCQSVNHTPLRLGFPGLVHLCGQVCQSFNHTPLTESLIVN